MTNERLLRSKMALYGDTYTALAKHLNVTRATIHHKVNGNGQFTQNQMLMIKQRYNLTNDEFIELFLGEEVASASE